jgi:hypothetical protein
METYYIPNTKVYAEIVKHSGQYASLFLASGEVGNNKNIGSVNAGTSNAGHVFAVGLGGINIAFEHSLKAANQNTHLYQTIHKQLFDAAGTNLSEVSSNFSPNDPVQFSLIQKPDASYNLPQYDGIVFVDIFNAKQIPHHNDLNYSMIYVVPPNRSNYHDDASFFEAIEATCITIVTALDSYNSKYAVSGNSLGLMPINNIRMCLFSGEIYAGGTSPLDVAKHNLKGLEIGLSGSMNSNSTIDLVEFEFDSIESYLTPVQ